MISPRNKRNPYIIGRSIDEQELFFGRESLFRFIEDNLSNNQQVILLHGQRRIGKSSVLQQIRQQVNLDNKFVFVLSDFQDKSQWSFHEIIHKLAEEIFEHLEISTNDLASIQDLEKDADKFSQLLNPIFQKLGNRNLVLLLDEFDVLNTENNDSGFEDFFGYLRQIVSQERQLFIIPVVGRRLSDMPKLLKLYRGAPQQRIGLLDRLSTRMLITKPVRKFLQYNDRVINEIIRLSAGHPYFTQAICSALFVQAREQGKTKILGGDADTVIDNAIELSEPGLVWFREGLLIPERVVFSAAAVAQEKARQKNQSPPENPLNLLKSIGVNIEQLLPAQQALIDNDFLDADGNRVTIEFVRHWLLKYYPLQSEIWELEKLDPEADYYYERANIWRNRRNIDNELHHYRMALELNPNHFSALFRLAEAYRKNQQFQEAKELYDRAYKINPQRAKEGYIESLLGYGDHLIQTKGWIEKKLSLVKKPYEMVLEIESNNTKALEKLKYLRAKEKPRNISVSHGKKSQQIPIRLVVLTAILAVPMLIGIGIFLGLQFQQNSDYSSGKSNGDLQETERFSSGEITLFSNSYETKYNDNFLNCNQEFQSNNYSEAANCFAALVKAKRNEPEPLIYQNNSLAYESGNPITLAVVVPADTESKIAKEILRGVAQAQDEFNQDRLSNDRLLEIVIVNDSNEPKISQTVAQEIVKNRASILGVIGHDSSNASKAGLEVYEAQKKSQKLAIISPTSTSTKLKSDIFFRTVINNSILSKKLAKYAQELGIRKVVIFYNDQSSYSLSLKEHFSFHLKRKEITKVDLKEQSFYLEVAVKTAVENQIKAGMLFADVNTIDSAIKIATTNYELPEKQRLKLLGGDSLYNCDTLNKGKQAVKGLILAVPWFKKLLTAEPFLERAKVQWGGPVSWVTATSYDATKAFIYALSNSGNNPTRFEVLEKLKEVNLPANETSGQNLRFSPEGEREGEAFLVEVVESPNPDCSDLDFRLLEE
ncbi:ABC transporter substrate-binding protein [Okeania sp. SIO2B3]|uniref:ABC transporter substrate-binding protein n=1 Tax=Okeania sp. SIO2B3 TaxID=2607784 RepID=UPI0013C1DA20|nr:ABC transporter substrate-binding protein [Okeania sp. SIO2B3]NET41012.1 ABC transporter substrate-binding protein [Okeania sp. SIO2B3]